MRRGCVFRPSGMLRDVRRITPMTTGRVSRLRTRATCRSPTLGPCTALSPDVEIGARGDRRRESSMDRVDDLAAVDALEIDARVTQVRVLELPLDHDHRTPSCAIS